jgi:hypothetical protein
MFHLCGLLIAMYFLPTLIASARNLHSRIGILMVNLFLGWTFVGWVAALIWAIAAPAPYVVYGQPPYSPYPPYPPQSYPPYPPQYR